MKSRAAILIILPALIAVLAAPIQLSAQKHTHYTLIDLGTIGGPQSYFYVPNNFAQILNNQGTLAGYADTPTQDPFQSFNFCFVGDCMVTHAFESKDGTITDLNVLPGGSSSAAGWISPNGLIAGWSQNGSIDPSFPNFPATHGVLWKNGEMTDLTTLAEGSESAALAVNSSGLVVGAADNSIADANPLFSDSYGWATQTRAFMWQDGVMKDLGTLGGTDAVALLVNERGQIAGISYTSSIPSAYCAAADLGANLATGAFIYENGKMKNLGSFGGTCTFATDLNDRGQIVGLSTLKGDKFQHAFLWENDSLQDLPNMIGGKNSAAIQVNNQGVAVGWVSTSIGLVPQVAALWKHGDMKLLGSVDGDLCSNAYSINSKEQVVGVSAPACDFGQQRAFLWENGSLADLNTLLPSGSTLYLTAPETINDRGEIAGIGLDANGNQHAFLLIPCGRDDDACQDAAGYPAFRPAPNINRLSNDRNAIHRTPRRGSRPASEIPPPNTSSAGRVEPVKSMPLAEDVFNKADRALPDLSDSLDAGVFRSETAPKCGGYGWPCFLPKVYDGCCPGLKCVFHGGSTRVGYECR